MTIACETPWKGCACCGRRVLGWMYRERGVPLKELRLAHVVPSSDRGSVAVAFDYMQWLIAERGISAPTQGEGCCTPTKGSL